VRNPAARADPERTAAATFERDRRKSAVLTRARRLVLRTTWIELNDEPYALVARIAEALADATPSRG